jgi:hypothetical protein
MGHMLYIILFCGTVMHVIFLYYRIMDAVLFYSVVGMSPHCIRMYSERAENGST